MKKAHLYADRYKPMVGGAAAFATAYNEPAKAKAAVGIEAFDLMSYYLLPAKTITPSCSIGRPVPARFRPPCRLTCPC